MFSTHATSRARPESALMQQYPVPLRLLEEWLSVLALTVVGPAQRERSGKCL
jgi:hypothetical protein